MNPSDSNSRSGQVAPQKALRCPVVHVLGKGATSRNPKAVGLHVQYINIRVVAGNSAGSPEMCGSEDAMSEAGRMLLLRALITRRRSGTLTPDNLAD